MKQKGLIMRVAISQVLDRFSQALMELRLKIEAVADECPARQKN
jgi:hypothetical protein